MFSLSVLTGNLILKVFIDNKLVLDLIKLNADLGDTTVPGYRAVFRLSKRISILEGQKIVFGWEMSEGEQIQLVHKTIAVDVSYPFGLNQALTGIADGSVISATIPPVEPSSGEWFIPVYCKSYKIYDTSNPNGYVIDGEFNEHKENPVHELVVSTFSSNVLNTATSIPDKYIGHAGNLLPSNPLGTFAASEFIAWGSNTQACFGDDGVPYPYFSVAQYDANKVFIAGTGFTSINVDTLTKASGAYYFRIGYRIAYLNQVNFGETLLAYEPFSRKVSEDTFGNAVVFRPDMTDESLVEKFEQLEDQFASGDDKVKMASKNGGQSYNEVAQINPPGNLWRVDLTYIKKWWEIWLKGISTKVINRISIPIVKNFLDGLNFTDGTHCENFSQRCFETFKSYSFFWKFLLIML